MKPNVHFYIWQIIITLWVALVQYAILPKMRDKIDTLERKVQQLEKEKEKQRELNRPPDF